MANIKMNRVDFRLVHGQVAGTWIKHLSVNKIIILCDEVGNDPFMIEMFNLAAPAGCDIAAYTVDAGCDAYAKGEWGEENAIVLFKHIEEAKRARDAGYDFKELNVGQVPKGEGRKPVTNTVYISEAEMDTLRQLSESGVHVYLQPVPLEPPLELEQAAEKL